MVCDDSQRRVLLHHLLDGKFNTRFIFWSERPLAGELDGSLDQRRKQIRLVIRNHSLQHRRHPLQPHSRIDRRLGQRIQRPRRIAVKLHEHQVPDLHIPPAIAWRTHNRHGPDRTPPRPCRSKSRCTGRRGRCPPSARSCPWPHRQRSDPSAHPARSTPRSASPSRGTIPSSGPAPSKIVT